MVSARGAAHAGRVDARVWLALWVVYIVWGSTYFAIRLGVRPSHGAAMPPLIYAGIRFVVAGGILLAFSVRRPAPDGRPDPLGRRQWFAASVIGLALLLAGNGLVSIAEKRIPSGIAALVVATVPIWTALLGAAAGHERVTLRHGLGLLLGFAGVAALVGGTGSGRVQVTGLVMVLCASLAWAAGSVWSRTAPVVRRPLVLTGMQMVAGGAGCLVVGFAIGEGGDLHLADVSAGAWAALAYLIVFGSLGAYTAYVWLLRNARLSLVTTYAFVNPLVAIFLGCVFLSEPFTPRTVLATVLIVFGVMLMVIRRSTSPARPHQRGGDLPEARVAGAEGDMPPAPEAESRRAAAAGPAREAAERR